MWFRVSNPSFCYSVDDLVFNLQNVKFCLMHWGFNLCTAISGWSCSSATDAEDDPALAQDKSALSVLFWCLKWVGAGPDLIGASNECCVVCPVLRCCHLCCEALHMRENLMCVAVWKLWRVVVCRFASVWCSYAVCSKGWKFWTKVRGVVCVNSGFRCPHPALHLCKSEVYLLCSLLVMKTNLQPEVYLMYSVGDCSDLICLCCSQLVVGDVVVLLHFSISFSGLVSICVLHCALNLCGFWFSLLYSGFVP